MPSDHFQAYFMALFSESMRYAKVLDHISKVDKTLRPPTAMPGQIPFALLVAPGATLPPVSINVATMGNFLQGRIPTPTSSMVTIMVLGITDCSCATAFCY